MSRSTIALATVLLVTLAACGGEADATSAPAGTTGSNQVKIAVAAGDPYTETTIDIDVQEDLRAKLPAEIRDSGKLVIGVGALPAGFPPLAFVGTDQKTVTGAEPDLGRLVAATLGLEAEVSNVTWENLFVGIDSGRNDVGFSNITDTEERKQKYDFAAYRKDDLAFQVKKESTWNFDGDYRNLEGLVVSVGRGTNQEKILLEWQKKLQGEGKDFEIKYFPDNNSIKLALTSGKIDAYFGPNPGIQYEVARGASGSSPTRGAGQWSGAGDTLQGLIAATTKKDNGLVEPLAGAIDYLIENGQYEAWLKAYQLENEAVEKAEINPPGLPLDNS
ncbi:putative amino acid ABC transporter, substrate-binding protein [Kineosporia sp. NBRC 101677]|uniref:transporter substrate-binding domain-containing protein n=1 Tax=Kineosporia sp. NBRC 101677 TaxID=3032197 RepID=UPI0024A30F2B|nr:transporter substrate-binding domain-containing protein [Kineosporia sp. NBRC 101677]GLY16084.1 putative amino acid ABC transporter, substrate-binding protein [Kineosporia sp. NBRC 101677]